MIFFYASLITYYIYTFLKYKSTYAQLQKSKYDTKKYIKQLNKKTFINKELIIIPLIIIALNLDLKTIEVSTVIAYTLLAFIKIKEKSKVKLEKKFIVRLIPLIIILILLNIWIIIDYMNHHNTEGIIFDSSSIYYIVLYTFTYISYLLILIINLIVKPIDKLLK